MAEKKHNASRRAMRLWQRLSEWYGARFSEQFGAAPTEDWCEIVDDNDNDTVKLALSEIRKAHTTHPPTLPEFEAIVARCKAPQNTGPSNSDRLAEWVLNNKPLTLRQKYMPWTYFGQMSDGRNAAGKMERNHTVHITGVIVPADGEHSGYRVTLEDMQLGVAA